MSVEYPHRLAILGGRISFMLAVISVASIVGSALLAQAADDVRAHDRMGSAKCCSSEAAEASESAYARSIVEVEVPDVTLVDASGRSFSLRSLLEADGGPVMLNFIFTSCTTICPVLSATFSQIDQDLEKRNEHVRLVSITIDPEHDTSERLAAYARLHHADKRWLFLTGNREAIDTVQKAFGAYRGSKFNHAPLTFIHRRGTGSWIRLEGLGDAAGLWAEYKRSGEAG